MNRGPQAVSSMQVQQFSNQKSQRLGNAQAGEEPHPAFLSGVLSGIKPVISPALTSCARRKALLNWWNEWVTGWCCRAALRGHWMLLLPLDYLGTHLSEILETSFLQALGVYTAYLLQVLIPRWNQCSSSTNSRTTSKCLGKEAVTWRTSRFLDEARRHNPALGEMTFQKKGVCGFLGWFGVFFFSLILQTHCWATNAHGD